MSNNGEGSWWTNKFVLGPLLAGLSAIFVAVATPVGDRVREIIFPTSTVVEGFVQKEAKPVPKVKVVLDERTRTTTTDSGRFLFQNVPWGVHSIKVLTEGEQLLFSDQFFVKQGEKEKNLGAIQLDTMPVAKRPEEAERLATNPAFVDERRQPDYRVDLMHEARPLEERRPGFESNIYHIAVWVVGTERVLSRIERVTYYLHPTFNPSVVTRYSLEDKFTLSLTAWGQFTLKAKVYFKDGQVKDLSRYLSF